MTDNRLPCAAIARSPVGRSAVPSHAVRACQWVGACLGRRKADTTLVQFVRYTFVGGLSFLVDAGTLVLATEWLELHYLVSAIIGFQVGLATNYALSTLWVFSRRVMRHRGWEFVLFAAVGLVGLGINELVLWFLTGFVGVHYGGSKCAAAVLVYLWNFSARKLTLFR